MDQNKDYYAILGVHPTAEKTVIDAAYKALAKRYHPFINDFSKIDYKWISENVLILNCHNIVTVYENSDWN